MFKQYSPYFILRPHCLLAAMLLFGAFALPQSSHAEIVEIGDSWLCELDETGMAKGIAQIKRGAQVESDFPRAKKIAKRVLSKARKKLVVARERGIKKNIKRAKAKVKSSKSVLQDIRSCEQGTLDPDSTKSG